MDQSFPRALRLNQAADYKTVMTQRQAVHSEALRLKASPNDCGHARLGTIVGKRSIPRAVERHRLKRLMREHFRCHRASLAAIDVVVMALPSAKGASNEEIRECLTQLWQKLNKRYAAPSRG